MQFVLASFLSGSPDGGARALALAAYHRGSLDNISVLVLDLRRKPKETTPPRSPNVPADARSTNLGARAGHEGSAALAS